MDFTLTADHEAIRKTAREFCHRELVPHLRTGIVLRNFRVRLYGKWV